MGDGTFDRPGREPAIVFLHGAGSNRHMWIPQTDRIGDWRVLAIDLPGHGERAGGSWDYDDAIDSVCEVISALTVPPTLVGLSLGGYVAIGVAAARPELVGGLVVSGATAEYRGWGGITTRLAGVLLPLFARAVDRKNVENIRRLVGEEVANAIVGGGMSTGAAAAALRTMPGRDYAAMLGRYPGPTLILNGERDTPNRAGQARALEMAPGSRLIVIEDAGHACSLSKPDAFTTAVCDFHEGRVASA